MEITVPLVLMKIRDRERSRCNKNVNFSAKHSVARVKFERAMARLQSSRLSAGKDQEFILGYDKSRGRRGPDMSRWCNGFGEMAMRQSGRFGSLVSWNS